MDQNNGQGESALPNFADIVRPLPFWTRVVYFGLTISWLFDFITRFPSEYLACSVQKILDYNMFWTLFTSAFYVDSLFFLTIIIYNFHSFLPKLEQRSSTPFILLAFLGDNIMIQVFTLLLQYLIGYEVYPLNGVNGVWFCMLTKYCYFNPEGDIKFCCLSWKIKKILYPFILMAVFTLLKFSLPIDLAVGIAYGLLQAKISSFMPKSKFFSSKVGKVLTFISIQSWIHYEQGRHEKCIVPYAYENLQNFEMNSLAEKSQNSDPFASKQGYRIGDY